MSSKNAKNVKQKKLTDYIVNNNKVADKLGIVEVRGRVFKYVIKFNGVNQYTLTSSKFEVVNSVPPAYLLGSYYDGSARRVFLKFYDDKEDKVYIWFDQTGHMPYFLTDIPPNKLLEKNKLVRDPSFERLEQVRKYDLLRGREVTLTKVVVKDPLAVPKLKGLVGSVWEAKIKYHDNYIFDNKLVPGMRYRVDGKEFHEVRDEIPENVIKLYKDAVGQDKELLDFALRLAPLFEEKPPKMRRLAVDIEVYTPVKSRVPDPDKANYPVISVSLVSSDGLKKVLVLVRDGLKLGSPHIITRNDIEIELFDNEKDLLLEVFRIINSYPLIITFNGDNFDLPYLHNRALELGIKPEEIPIKNVRDFVGVNHGFHIDLYKFFSIEAIQNYAFSQAYKEKTLDAIAQALLGESKVVVEESVSDLTLANLVEYNLKDAELTLKLTTFNNELVWKLIVLIMRLAKMSLEDVTRRKVSAWVKNLMYWEHRFRGYLIPNKEELEQLKGGVKTSAKIDGKSFAGAIVIDPIPGVYFKALVLDFASLYPSIIKVWNLSYETIDPPQGLCSDEHLVDVKDEKGVTLHKVCMDKKGITSMIVGLLRDFRVRVYKKLAKQTQDEELKSWYDVVQRAMKVYINASYGVFGHASFPFYTPSLAESVTALGRYVITTTIAKAKSLGLRVLYGDTDSLFLWDPDEEKLNQLIKWVETELNLEIEQDKVYKYVAFALKKNYLGVLEDGKIDIKGLVGKKKNVPKIIQESFAKVVNLIKNIEENVESLERVKEEIRKEVKNLYQRLKNKDFTLDEVAFKTTLSKDLKSYNKTTPIHVKAALQLVKNGVPISKGETILYIKARTKDKVKPVQLAKVDDIDIAEYLETAKSVFQQLLIPFNISWEEIAGTTGLTQFKLGNHAT